ncbi:SRPBCC family protein [Streptomyces sp. CG1]|uniref:SRPBCC family protein n=1 Tax=Streptomyces sp. CG1 TaxID=1287523 RepID=UPI0034E28C86
MAVLNVHERLLSARPEAVGELIDTLAGADDRLWPVEQWPPMELDRGLTVGSSGGHGPVVRYTVVGYAPGQWVRFAFREPRGFHGFHEFAVQPADDDRAVLRHTVAMRLRGSARLTWPLMIRWLHDAVLEDCLDRAEHALTGSVVSPARRSAYVRFLRRLRARSSS